MPRRPRVNVGELKAARIAAHPDKPGGSHEAFIEADRRYQAATKQTATPAPVDHSRKIKRLTDAGIKALEPEAKLKRYWDPQLPGFGVAVTPTGAKTFGVMKSDRRGRASQLAGDRTLSGNGLATARDKAKAVLLTSSPASVQFIVTTSTATRGASLSLCGRARCCVSSTHPLGRRSRLLHSACGVRSWSVSTRNWHPRSSPCATADGVINNGGSHDPSVLR